jgi:hypothetical protein
VVPTSQKQWYCSKSEVIGCIFNTTSHRELWVTKYMYVYTTILWSLYLTSCRSAFTNYSMTPNNNSDCCALGLFMQWSVIQPISCGDTSFNLNLHVLSSYIVAVYI